MSKSSSRRYNSRKKNVSDVRRNIPKYYSKKKQRGAGRLRRRDPKNKQKSVFSLDAMLERKIEIIDVKLVQ